MHLERILRVVGCQQFAVVELDIVAQIEGVGKPVCGDFPRLGRVGFKGHTVTQHVIQLAE